MKIARLSYATLLIGAISGTPFLTSPGISTAASTTSLIAGNWQYSGNGISFRCPHLPGLR
jgi:hypothetical protein